jgi:hypothetical protein
MTARKPGTRNSTAKSGKRLKLNKRTLKDLGPAKGGAVRGGGILGGTTVIKTIGDGLQTVARTG